MDEFTKLLQLAREGNQDALGTLLDRDRDRLRELARQELGPEVQFRADASDLVQQTILSAFRKFGDFDGAAEPQLHAWLERILERNVQDTVGQHLKAQKRSVSQEVPLGFVGELEGSHTGREDGMNTITHSEDAEWLLTQIESLPPDQAFAVRLRHLEEMALKDIANVMGRSNLAVTSLIKRGVASLRERAKHKSREEE